MEKHYFTFGASPERVQIVISERPEEAEQIMFRFWGNRWAFQYTEEQWNQALREGYFQNVFYLKPLKVKKKAKK